MNIAEGILLILLVLGGYQGYKRGVLREVTGLFALILGVIAGIIFVEEGKIFISKFLNTYSPVLSFFSFVLIFVCVVILTNLLGKTIKTTIDLTPIGFLDNIGGALLGFAKWLFYVSVMLWLLDVMEISVQDIDDSQWYAQVHDVAPYVIHKAEIWFPSIKGFYMEIKNFLESLNET